MSKVTDTSIGGGFGTLDKRYNRRFFASGIGNVTKKRTLFRREDIKNLPTYSLLTQCADAWFLLTSGEKAAWETAALACDLSGYNLFIQDKTYRLMNEIAGNATPNNYHQYLVGHLDIPEGAGDFLLKKVGNEIMSLPATLHINRNAVLTADPAGGEFIKVRFSYVYDDGGGPEWQSDELSLAKSSSWGTETLAITQQTNPTGVFYLEIEGHNVKGDFYFDNFYVSDLNGILTSDRPCEKVENKFNGIIIPAGMTYSSIYPAD